MMNLDKSPKTTPTVYTLITSKVFGLLKWSSTDSHGKSDVANNLRQYDAVPVGVTGTYDPAADEIFCTFQQTLRHNRRRFLVPQSQDSETELDEISGVGSVSTGWKRKNRGSRKDSNGDGSSLDKKASGNGECEAEEDDVSTESFYVLLLVFTSTALSLWAAYLVLT